MVRYMTMKRITQILASVLFIITVLTVYLAFDFAISNAVSHKTALHKRSPHHPSDEIKITRKRSMTAPILSQRRKSNHTQNQHVEHEQLPPRKNKAPLRAKPGSFHKGKTGVKVNKPKKSLKEQRKHLSTSTARSLHRDKHHV